VVHREVLMDFRFSLSVRNVEDPMVLWSVKAGMKGVNFFRAP
jgi:hypothetical protein